MAGRDVRAICLDIGERAGWTAGQQFVAVLLAASGAENLFDMPWESLSALRWVPPSSRS